MGSGDYFETVPIQLKAVPEAGYEFSHWGGESDSTEETIYIDLTDLTDSDSLFLSCEFP